MSTAMGVGLFLLWSISAAADNMPPPEAFQVLPTPESVRAEITPYLSYEMEMTGRQDDARRRTWEAIRTVQDVKRLQQRSRANLLSMLGGLPREKTPLCPRITGRIQMQGFHIEKP